MKKRYIPAFIAEGIALVSIGYNALEMLINHDMFLMRPGLWALGFLITVATLPAFIMWLLEKK